MFKKMMLALAMVAGATAATAAPIGFNGAYDYATWTVTRTNTADPTGNSGTGGSSQISGDKQTLTLFEPDSGGGSNGFTFSHSVLQTGTLSFNWSFNGQADACCSGFSVYVNNTQIVLANAAFGVPYSYTGPLLSGVFSQTVNAGDVFRFQQFSTDSCCGASYTTITNFDAASVPEPAMLALFGVGLFGVGAARRRRRIAA